MTISFSFAISPVPSPLLCSSLTRSCKPCCFPIVLWSYQPWCRQRQDLRRPWSPLLSDLKVSSAGLALEAYHQSPSDRYKTYPECWEPEYLCLEKNNLNFVCFAVEWEKIPAPGGPMRMVRSCWAGVGVTGPLVFDSSAAIFALSWETSDFR